MRLEGIIKNYWVLILIVMAVMIFDVGVTAVLIIQENPTTKKVRNGEGSLFEEHQLKLPEQIVGTHIEWDRPPSKLLKTTESLMVPLVVAFLLISIGGVALKILNDKRKTDQA